MDKYTRKMYTRALGTHFRKGRKEKEVEEMAEYLKNDEESGNVVFRQYEKN